jgi:hypothetical protein
VHRLHCGKRGLKALLHRLDPAGGGERLVARAIDLEAFRRLDRRILQFVEGSPLCGRGLTWDVLLVLLNPPQDFMSCRAGARPGHPISCQKLRKVGFDHFLIPFETDPRHLGDMQEPVFH